MPKNPSVAEQATKNTSFLLMGTAFRMIANFVFIVVSADMLGIEGFGAYSIGLHYFELFAGLAGAGIGQLLTNEIAKWSRRSNQLISSAILIGLLMALLGIVAMIGFSFVGGFKPSTRLLVLIASLALVPGTICIVFEGALIGLQRSEFVALSVTVESLFRSSLSIAAICLGFGIPVLFLILIVGKCLQLSVFWWSIRKSFQFKWAFSRRNSIRMAKRLRVYAVETWLATVNVGLDILILSILAGEFAVGIYSAAWKVIRMGAIVARVYAQATFPILSKQFQKSRASFHRMKLANIRLMCVLPLPVLICISYYSELIIKTIYPSGLYAESAIVLAVLAFYVLQEFLNPFLSFSLYASGRQIQTMKVAAISLVFNAMTTYPLVLYFGAFGAAVGTLMAGTLATICYLYFSLSREEIKWIGFIFLRQTFSCAILLLLLLLMTDLNLFLASVAASLAYYLVAIGLKLVGHDDWQLLNETLIKKFIPRGNAV